MRFIIIINIFALISVTTIARTVSDINFKQNIEPQTQTSKMIYEDIIIYKNGTIANYKKRYREGGLEGLILDNYSTRRTKLTELEEIELEANAEAEIFLSIKEIVTFIKKKFKVKYSISGCTNLLHRLGFSYKKSKGVPGKEKEVLTNSGRGRVNIFGAVCIYNQDIVTRSYDTINQGSVCNFLKALRARNPDVMKQFTLF